MPLNVELRPWGAFEVMGSFGVESTKGQDVMVKKIVVKPLARPSYQSHHLRQEHWVIVQGKGKVIINGNEQEITTGDMIAIPKNTKHRIINTESASELIFIEVSTGHFDEYDIVRYEDDFNRV